MVGRLKGLAQASRRALILDIHTMAPLHPASLVTPSANDPESLRKYVETWTDSTRRADPARNRPVTVAHIANGEVVGNADLSSNLSLGFAAEDERTALNRGILYDRQTHTGAALMAEGGKGVVLNLPKVELTNRPQRVVDLADMRVYRPLTDRMGLIIADAVRITLTSA